MKDPDPLPSLAGESTRHGSDFAHFAGREIEAAKMICISIEYVGDLHCRATHTPSGVKLMTDAPADNMGKGETFSPTDLVATALGPCILTVMGTKAQSMGIDLTGSTVVVDKEMASGRGGLVAYLQQSYTLGWRHTSLPKEPLTILGSLTMAGCGMSAYRAVRVHSSLSRSRMGN